MADEPLIDAQPPRLPQTLRTHTARIVVTALTHDQNGLPVEVKSLEVDLKDPTLPGQLKLDLVQIVKRIGQHLGRIA